jgi:uncharacterized protein (TIGR03643 family)
MATKTRLKTSVGTHFPRNSALQQMAQSTTDSANHSRIIEMAWEDRTPFEAIQHLYGLSEAQVIRLMRRSLKTKAFKNWRTRVAGRSTKHLSRRDPSVSRGYCATQYKLPSK